MRQLSWQIPAIRLRRAGGTPSAGRPRDGAQHLAGEKRRIDRIARVCRAQEAVPDLTFRVAPDARVGWIDVAQHLPSVAGLDESDSPGLVDRRDDPGTIWRVTRVGAR